MGLLEAEAPEPREAACLGFRVQDSLFVGGESCFRERVSQAHRLETQQERRRRLQTQTGWGRSLRFPKCLAGHP